MAARLNYVYLCLASLISCSRVTVKGNTQKVYLLSLLPYPEFTRPSDHNAGTNVFLGGQIAVELINNRSDILDGYELELIEAASGCSNELHGLLSFINEVFHSGKRIMGVIGPKCSKSNALLTPLLNREEISLIHFHLSLVPVLENGIRYPYSFSTSRTLDTLVTAAAELMQRNQWYEVVILYDDLQRYFHYLYFAFERQLSQVPNYKVVFSSPIAPFLQGSSILHGFERRVIFLMAGQEESRQIICNAYFQEIVYPTYQWVVIGSRMNINGFRRSVQAGKYNCSGEQLIRALNNSFFIDYNRDPLHDKSTTDLGISYDDFFFQKYTTKMTEIESGSQESPNEFDIVYNVVMAHFDAVLSMALALNNSIPALRGLNLSLEDYGYGNTEGTKAIAERILDLDFASVSGRIKFDSRTGFVLHRLTYIYQVQGNTSHVIGEYNITELTVKFHNDSIQNVISSNYTVVRENVPTYIIVVHLLIMTVLFGTTVAVHVVTMVYRNFKSIKASSPNVNYLAYAGLYILFVDAMIVTTRDGFPINKQAYGGLCNASNFTFYVGITLLLGTICAKTWRLYRIFVHYLEPGYFLRSRFLIAFTLMVVSVDIVLCVLWTVIDPMEEQTAPAKTSSADENGNIYVGANCISNNRIVWMIILTGYQLIIGGCALCLAILSRHITLKDFSTRGVALFSYFSLFAFGLGISMSVIMVLITNSLVNFLVHAFLIYIIMALCLVLVLIPPIFPLLNKKAHFYAKHLDLYSS